MARPQNRGRRMGGRRRMRKKVSVLTKEKIEYVDYKDVNLLKRFISDRAKIRARRITGNNEQQQRAVALAIKNAREMALLPYENRVTSQRRILESGQFGMLTHEDAMDEQTEGEFFTPGGGAMADISARGTPSAAAAVEPIADAEPAADVEPTADASEAEPAADVEPTASDVSEPDPVAPEPTPADSDSEPTPAAADPEPTAADAEPTAVDSEPTGSDANPGSDPEPADDETQGAQ